jgi:hypothetical protein
MAEYLQLYEMQYPKTFDQNWPNREPCRRESEQRHEQHDF